MNGWTDILFAISIALACMLGYVAYELNELKQSYELTDQELLDLEDELNEKGIIDGKKD